MGSDEDRYSFKNPYTKIHEEVEREYSSKIAKVKQEYFSKIAESSSQLAEYYSRLEECKVKLRKLREEVAEYKVEREIGISNVMTYLGCSREMALKILDGSLAPKLVVEELGSIGDAESSEQFATVD